MDCSSHFLKVFHVSYDASHWYRVSYPLALIRTKFFRWNSCEKVYLQIMYVSCSRCYFALVLDGLVACLEQTTTIIISRVKKKKRAFLENNFVT